MGELARFIEEISRDNRINRIRFSDLFLEDVGNILHMRGFNEARLFVWNLRDRMDVERQVLPMLLILGKMEGISRIKEDRSVGGYILKNKLNQLVKCK